LRFLWIFQMKLVGKSVGGPAKVAVFSSALVGMVNGTAVGKLSSHRASVYSHNEEDGLQTTLCSSG